MNSLPSKPACHSRLSFGRQGRVREGVIPNASLTPTPN